jgi:uncharacterized protein (TIGR02145 family)
MNPFNYRLVKRMQGAMIITLLLLGLSLIAQPPQAFKYQAVVRDASGAPIVLTNVSMRISILSGGIEGVEVYREVHNVITSSGGLITLDIGSGTPDIGLFDQIAWGLDDFFVKVEVDPLGGVDFIFMGASQLLSVPYAIYAKEAGGPPSYTWEQLQNHLVNRTVTGAEPGMMVFVSDEGKMIYYNGEEWVTTAGECFPQPSEANAGEDQEDVEGTSTYLSAESPKFGTGVWSIISEANGQILNISDVYDPAALLETTGGNFILQWTVTNECGETSDQVNISFCPDNTLADAGENQSGITGNSFQLGANIPGIGNTGTWTIVNGTGGTFSSVNDPNALFTGMPGVVYTLRWTIATGCDSNYDDIEVGFCYTLTIANAGSDQINVNGTATVLQGNQPGAGNTGVWNIISGEGGVIANSGLYNSGFSGLPDETYVLRWTINSDCQESYDEVTISFCPVLTIANAGPDQTDLAGTSVQLAANVPGTSNSGIWAIESMMGPLTVDESFLDPSDPQTIFNGNPGVTYVLSWTISTVCDESIDYVTVSFCPVLDTADAGPDDLSACLPYVLSANEPGAGNTGGWTIVSGTGGSFGNANSPTSTFSGTPGSNYELAWTISNACGSSTDHLIIGFELFPAIAEAGPDQLNVEGNTVILAANTCNTGGTGQWSIVAGEGGSFADIFDPATTFTGLPNGEVYELKWTISTSCYSSEDNVNVSFIPVFICGDDLIDPRDEQVYPTVQIGDQCWMAKNLNVGVQVFSGVAPTNNGIIEKYCFNNQAANCGVYGGLYHWNEAMNYIPVEGFQGICPQGWHMPTDAEWIAMLTHVGDSASCKLRITGTDYWTTNDCATNETGFSALGAGRINGISTYINLKANTYFWTSTQSAPDRSFQYSFFSTSVDLFKVSQPRGDGLSIRCIKTN